MLACERDVEEWGGRGGDRALAGLGLRVGGRVGGRDSVGRDKNRRGNRRWEIWGDTVMRILDSR